MTHQIITLKLFGKEHQIQCEDTQVEILKSAAVSLSKKTKKIQQKSNLSLDNAILLTALNLCGEQISTQKKNESKLTKQEEIIIESLNKNITDALASH